MAKIFYTERDIEDMAAAGKISLELNDDIVMTDLAYEKARRLGLKLVRENEKPPAAPVRPYLTKEQQTKAAETPSESRDTSDLKGRIREAVFARMGNQVDPGLLDVILERVLTNVGVR